MVKVTSWQFLAIAKSTTNSFGWLHVHMHALLPSSCYVCIAMLVSGGLQSSCGEVSAGLLMNARSTTSSFLVAAWACSTRACFVKTLFGTLLLCVSYCLGLNCALVGVWPVRVACQEVGLL